MIASWFTHTATAQAQPRAGGSDVSRAVASRSDSGAAASRRSPTEATERPGVRFAAGVLNDAAAGLVLRDLAIEDNTTALRLQVTMASPERAREHTLGFSPGGDRAVTYAARTVKVPNQRRLYPVEAELLRFLALAPPDRLLTECADYYLESAQAGVSVEPQLYYTVDGRSVGGDAPAAFRRAMRAAVDDRMELSSVTASRSGAQRSGESTVELVFDGDGRRLIHATLDGAGRITAVEVRTGPRSLMWQVYTRPKALHRALRGRGLRDLRAIEIVGRGEARDDGETGEASMTDASIVLVGSQRFRIDMVHFEPGDVECGC